MNPLEQSPDPRFYQLRDAAFDDLSAAERLIAADPSILEARSSIGETALQYLVVENKREGVEFLVSRGAVVDTQNDFGDTPLLDAASLGYLEMCQYLIGHGANFRHFSGHSEHSAFSLAASADQIEVLTYLLGLLEPEEDVNGFIEDFDAEIILESHEASARLLVERGLKKRFS